MSDQLQESAAILWSDVVQLAREGNDPSIVPWIERLIPISLDENTLVTAARQKWTEQKVMKEYRDTIEGYIYEITLEHIQLSCIIDPNAKTSGQEETTTTPPVSHDGTKPSTPVTSQAPAQPKSSPQEASHLPVVSDAPSQTQTSSSHAPHESIPESNGTPNEGTGDIDELSPADDITREGISIVVDNVTAETASHDQDGRGSKKGKNKKGAKPTGVLPPGNLAQYTFDTFIVGEANDQAYALARTMAEETVVPYNPLFLYSKSGLGKTHLLLAIYTYILMYRPEVKVLYATSNAFVEEYVDEITNKKLKGKEVMKKYREVDVLLVDDVQFFARKQESVGCFFDIFNQLTMDGKYVVLSADEPPDYLNLDERVKQRFSMGYVASIATPSNELKHTILKNYYETKRHQIVWLKGEINDDCLNYIAEISPNNIREMQGLLNKIMMDVNIKPTEPLTHEHIKEIRDELFKSEKRIEIPLIIGVVANEFGVSTSDIRGQKRTKAISEARQVTMWLARQLTDESYQSIGNCFNRDHSTVYNSISKIDRISQSDRNYLFKLERLKKEVRNRNE